MSISSYSDILKISPETKIIHLRKFASERLVKKIIEKNPQITKISFSRYTASRCNPSIFGMIIKRDIEVVIQQKGPGRPNLLEAII